jgi:hypothetical protein
MSFRGNIGIDFSDLTFPEGRIAGEMLTDGDQPRGPNAMRRSECGKAHGPG